MSKKGKKFDLTHLVHQGTLKDGQQLFYVSDPSKTCKIAKQPNGEFKVVGFGQTMTVHAFAEKCLGDTPPMHATKWLRTQDGKTLYDIWHAEEMAEAA